MIWYGIWPESAENLKYVLKCALQVRKILLDRQNVIIQCPSLILLRFQKFSFSQILHVFGHFEENWINQIKGRQPEEGTPQVISTSIYNSKRPRN